MSIKTMLMLRDGLTSDEADQFIKEAKDILHRYFNDKDYVITDAVSEKYFNLDIDHLVELI